MRIFVSLMALVCQQHSCIAVSRKQEAVRGAACNTESVRNIIGGQYLVLAHSRLPLGETWTAADDIAYAQRFE